MDDILNKAGIIVNAIRHEYAGKKIVMEADRVVNMVSKSLEQMYLNFLSLLQLQALFLHLLKTQYINING